MYDTAAETPVLEARGIRKVFRRENDKLVVLDGCDFSLQSGQAVAIMGESGSGKSTLLNILGVLDYCTSGEILHRGQLLDVSQRQVVDQWRTHKVGFVFQNHMLLPDFTAMENLLMPARRLGGLSEETRQRAHDFLDSMGLMDRADHLPGHLSGGEQQRIAVARAFMNKPDIVLADEPFGNLDQKIGGHLGEMLFGLMEREGTGLVIVTHDPHLAKQAQRTLMLDKGKLVAAAF